MLGLLHVPALRPAGNARHMGMVGKMPSVASASHAEAARKVSAADRGSPWASGEFAT